MRAVWRLLTSLKTCAWLGLLFTVSGALGSVVMGRFSEIFSDMDAKVLAEWFAEKGLADPVASLWLYGLIVSVGLLAINAVCCTADRLLQIFKGKVTLRRLLPHIMHVAFLGVVLSHLASAVSGDRIPGIQVPEGRWARLGETGMLIGLDKVHVEMAPEGYPKDYAAAVTLYRDGAIVARGWVRPNEPLFHEGYGIYLKTFGPTPWGAPFGEFDANRDPGAVGVFLSALLFTVANLIYLLPFGKPASFEGGDGGEDA